LWAEDERIGGGGSKTSDVSPLTMEHLGSAVNDFAKEATPEN
jgi:hypothetical protein